MHKVMYTNASQYVSNRDGTRWKQDKQRQLLQLTTNFVQFAAKCAIENREPDVARRILTFLSAQKLENIEKLAQQKLAISLMMHQFHSFKAITVDVHHT